MAIFIFFSTPLSVTRLKVATNSREGSIIVYRSWGLSFEETRQLIMITHKWIGSSSQVWAGQKCATIFVILGFQMTSPKFKPRKYWFFWVSTFMKYYSTQTPLFIEMFCSKSFFVLRLRSLEFPGFLVTRCWRPEKLLIRWVKNHTDFFWNFAI